MPDTAPVYVHLLPSLIPAGSLRGGVAVVVDVLRATTAMVHALDSGIESIRPCLEIDEALKLAATFSKGSVILGGERQGVPLEGFDFGNSPSSYTPEVCRGKTLVITTTNGTRAILASLDADRVFVAAFPNASASADAAAAAASGQPIHLVCSGTDGRISLEDSLLTGMLAARLVKTGRLLANDEAEIVARAWHAAYDGGHPLAETLANGRGGKRVAELGWSHDIATAATIDRFDFAAELLREPLRIVRV